MRETLQKIFQQTPNHPQIQFQCLLPQFLEEMK